MGGQAGMGNKKPLKAEGQKAFIAPLEPHRSPYWAGFGTLAARPGCRAIIGPVPSHHS